MATTTATAPGRTRTGGTRRTGGGRGGDERRVWSKVGLAVGVLLIAAYCLAPFYWMVVSSLKGQNDIFDNSLLPKHATMTNFRAVFSSTNHFDLALRNSLIISLTATIVALVVGMFAAYAMSRLRFRGKFLVLGAILATAMFPGIALLTPLFNLFTQLNWIDHYQAMVIPDISFTLPLSIWILTSFFSEMPWELEQAAKVDGATPGQAFRKVIVPLAAPGVFTTAILAFFACWNDFVFGISLTSTNNARPVPAALAFFTGASQFQQPTAAIAAAAVVVTIPIVIVTLVFQRRIVAGLTSGAVKG
jgi:multiple sugar transport system permease protein